MYQHLFYSKEGEFHYLVDSIVESSAFGPVYAADDLRCQLLVDANNDGVDVLGMSAEERHNYTDERILEMGYKYIMTFDANADITWNTKL